MPPPTIATASLSRPRTHPVGGGPREEDLRQRPERVEAERRAHQRREHHHVRTPQVES